MASKPLIPADALFGPAEMRMYVRFQATHYDNHLPSEYYPMPNPFEYDEFLEYRKEQSTKYLGDLAHFLSDDQDSESVVESIEGFELATKCGHALHPTNPLIARRNQAESGGESEGETMNKGESISNAHKHGGEAMDGSEGVDGGEEMDESDETDEWEDVDSEGSEEMSEESEVGGSLGVIRCPVCTLKAHMTFLARISDKWANLGGPWRNVPEGAPKGMYDLFRIQYHRLKVDLINIVDNYEDWATLEAEWEKSHPDQNVNAAKAWGATAAVYQYNRNIQFPDHVIDDDTFQKIEEEKEKLEGAEANPSTPVQKKKGLRLSFTPETPEDTRHRVNSYWSRSSRIYDPNSPHACPDKEGWLDTSRKSDWQYAISQCRILEPRLDEATDELVYKDLNVGPNRGDNEYVHRLLHLIEKEFTASAAPPQSWKAFYARTTDIFLMWKTGGQPTSIEDFDCWNSFPSLAGTSLEKYARYIGDIEEDDETIRNNQQVSGQAQPENVEVNMEAVDSEERPTDVVDPIVLDDDVVMEDSEEDEEGAQELYT